MNPKVCVFALMVAVVFIGAMNIPTLPVSPPDSWIITFGMTCIALGAVIGFGIKELLFPEDDRKEWY